MKKKTILFHDDNILSPTSNIAQTKKAWIGFRIASAFTVFSKPGPQRQSSFPKSLPLYGRHFESNEEVEWKIEGSFEGLEKTLPRVFKRNSVEELIFNKWENTNRFHLQLKMYTAGAYLATLKQ